MRKRLLAIIATVAMVVAMMPSMVFGATTLTASDEDGLVTAFSEVVSGDTIKLTDNIETSKTFTVPDGVKITLDMNGKKITATDTKTSGNYELFYIYGEMTVTGDGTIELSSTTNRNWNAMSTIFHNRGGVLTIENGTYKNLGVTDMAYVVDNSGNYYGDATTNISGGTLESTYTAIRNRMEQNSHGASGTAILNITGGTIEGTTSAIWAQAASTSTTSPATGEINISGGEIGIVNTARSAGAVCKTEVSGGSVAKIKAEKGEVSITDGYVGALEILDTDGNAVNADEIITGGEFGSDVSAYVADNSLMVAVKDASGNTTGYYVGDEAEEAVENALAGSIIDVMKAPANTEIKAPAGTKVENNTGAEIKVNDEALANGEEIEVTAKQEPNAGGEGGSTTEPEKSEDAVDTGDNMNTAIPFTAAGLALAAMAAVVTTRRRHN